MTFSKWVCWWWDIQNFGLCEGEKNLSLMHVLAREVLCTKLFDCGEVIPVLMSIHMFHVWHCSTDFIVLNFLLVRTGQINPYFAGNLCMIEDEQFKGTVPILTCLVRIPTLTFRVQPVTKVNIRFQSILFIMDVLLF